MAAYDPLTGMPRQKRNPFQPSFVPDAPAPSILGGGGRYDLPDFTPGRLSVTLPTVPQGSLPAGLPDFLGGSSVSNPQAPAGFSVGDLLSSIQSDPLYLQQRAQLAAEGVSDRAGLTAARQRALTLYGDVPDFGASSGMLGEGFQADVNETTRQLAQQNTAAGLSTKARIEQAHKDGLAAIRNGLAARGILSSGETGYQYGRADLANRQASSDAQQQLLDYLSGAQSAYVQSERGRQQSLQNALFAASGRLQPWMFGPAASPTAPPVEAPVTSPVTPAGWPPVDEPTTLPKERQLKPGRFGPFGGGGYVPV